MEFELMNVKTGIVFKKTISSIAKAMKFLDKVRYSNKLFLISYRYIGCQEVHY